MLSSDVSYVTQDTQIIHVFAIRFIHSWSPCFFSAVLRRWQNVLHSIQTESFVRRQITENNSSNLIQYKAKAHN